MYRQYSKGMIEVIAGPMFSGKSEELLKRFRILGHAKEKIVLIKPSYDTRYGVDMIKSRSGVQFNSYVAKDSDRVKELASDYNFVIIDEVQFFDLKIVDVIEELASSGKRVIVSGLDTDFRRKPFPVVAQLLAMAEHVTKLSAVCVICHNAATTTYRTSDSTETNLLGDDDIYQARCRTCHIEGTNKRKK
ncbi:thymidine kinase [Mycoplasma testudineum]|uniref:Thymidine kinase n=1 Tax=Mycoplasma testudineum TaxID=244584 RepID=A0A4R6IF79_9MOLU|nr:thymidine kinase [Mycoplasma testudineum]OYD26803.1 thymidine kinase [Mycoplasma testudineum]TDO20338.1 thymidine kinase [Mycoplasma testudineum]